MLKKSPFLTYVLSKTSALAAQDGKKAQNSNYFLAALYELMDSYAAGAHFEEAATPEGKKELENTYLTLSSYGKAFDEKREAILAFIHAEGYSSMSDDLLFGMFSFKAESHAKKNGKEQVDTPSYLAVVMAEPTAAIKKCVLGIADAPKAEEKSGISDALRDTIKELYTEEDEDEAAETPEKEEAKPQKKDGKQHLSESVAVARKTRDALLSKIFGQDVAVATFVSGYFQSELMAHTRAGGHKPAAAFLFAGPPGVGKTYLAECAAEALELPYHRFDMSEYASYDSGTVLAGSDKVYKDSKAGVLTGFVAKNPRCVLLFDEIEKAHLNVIHLFLQILDAGRLRDAYTDKEVSFSEAVIIFTTNAGRSLYEDPSVGSLSSLPKKTVLKALAVDRNPNTGAPLFPNAICSRFASGNVVMFNHLSAHDLFTIAKRELAKNTEGFLSSTGTAVNVSDAVATALLLAEGGHADARAVKGRANAFFHEELYELLRLIADDERAEGGAKLKTVDVDVYTEGAPEDVASMFVGKCPAEVLIFAEGQVARDAKARLSSLSVHVAKDKKTAEEILFEKDISVVLCDVRTGVRHGGEDFLNAEDIASEGHDFLTYALSKCAKPTYLLTERAGDVSVEEFLSFARLGVREVLSLSDDAFEERVSEACRTAYSQGNMLRLARENKVLTYKSAQSISEDRALAKIELFDFRLSLSRDMTDKGNILEGASKPAVRFSDVIGAEGAKEELSYFIDYLKDPVGYLRRGVHAPKGVLLYGPPGTGKTMLARAMAGESDVTFLTAEGNQFLKKYVGEGPEAVHALFATARKYAPSILFVDEIDAIAKSRDGADADYTADVLTAFLTEMDGFHTDTSKPVFVLAATNYALDGATRRRLDPALVRRFDRRIYVDLPNKAERLRFLTDARGKHPTVSLSDEALDNIAMRSTGLSLADLSQIFEMAIRSAIRTQGSVTDESLEEAFETYTGGDAKKHSEAELLRTARHEAGHALLCYAGGEVPAYVTIVARGDHGGYMQHAEREEKGVYTKSELLASIRTALGGRAAEMVCYADDGLTTGASGDLAAATRTAERMICDFGMDERFGLAVATDEEKRAMYPEIRRRLNEVLDAALAEAVAYIQEKRAVLDALASALLERNHLRSDELKAILEE